MSFSRSTAVAPVEDGSGTPGLTIVIPSYSQAVNELLVVGVKWEGSGGATCTVTDVANAVGGYSSPGRSVGPTQDFQIQLFYVLNSLASAVNVITATFGSAATYRGLKAMRFTYSGSTPTLVASSFGNNGTSVNLATAAYAAGLCGVFAGADFAGTTLTPLANWDATDEWDSSAIGAHMNSRIDNPGGNITGGGTLATSAEWAAVGLSFTDAGGGGGDTLLGQQLS